MTESIALNPWHQSGRAGGTRRSGKSERALTKPVLRRLTFDDLQHRCRLLHAARDWGEEALSGAAEAVFIAINKFHFGVAFTMGEFANDMLETIAPR